MTLTGNSRLVLPHWSGSESMSGQESVHPATGKGCNAKARCRPSSQSVAW